MISIILTITCNFLLQDCFIQKVKPLYNVIPYSYEFRINDHKSLVYQYVNASGAVEFITKVNSRKRNGRVKITSVRFQENHLVDSTIFESGRCIEKYDMPLFGKLTKGNILSDTTVMIDKQIQTLQAISYTSNNTTTTVTTITSFLKDTAIIFKMNNISCKIFTGNILIKSVTPADKEPLTFNFTFRSTYGLNIGLIANSIYLSSGITTKRLIDLQ